VRVQPRAKFVRGLCVGAICGVACLPVFVPVASKAAPDPLCLGVTATLVGTSGPDVLVGTPGKDVVVGGGGDDVIIGLGGRDRLCGGKGNDSIDGRGDRDAINGGPGSDTISGGRERDFLLGGRGDDTVDGKWGDDRMAGGAGADILAGGPGRDEVSFFAARHGVRANLVHHRANGEGHDTLLSIEDLDGSGFADVFVGDRPGTTSTGGTAMTSSEVVAGATG
jgi:Ca2+-binding RTX toxin-like protein